MIYSIWTHFIKSRHEYFNHRSSFIYRFLEHKIRMFPTKDKLTAIAIKLPWLINYEYTQYELAKNQPWTTFLWYILWSDANYIYYQGWSNLDKFTEPPAKYKRRIEGFIGQKELNLRSIYFHSCHGNILKIWSFWRCCVPVRKYKLPIDVFHSVNIDNVFTFAN